MSHPQETANFAAAPAGLPLVVGTVHSAESAEAATRWSQADGGPDLLELRVDRFADDPARLDVLTKLAPRPFILTVRCPQEGGANALTIVRRRELFSRFQPHARLVDLEVRSLEAFGGTIGSLLLEGRGLIASFHDFAGMPALPELQAQASRALEHGAHILKVAAMVRTGSDLAVLLEFLAVERRLPLSLMGMGLLGRASRPVLAAAGSVLNYGFLGDAAQVSGQWPAALLRERIDELLPGHLRFDAGAVIDDLLARAHSSKVRRHA